jgi:hypothetical protein
MAARTHNLQLPIPYELWINVTKATTFSRTDNNEHFSLPKSFNASLAVLVLNVYSYTFSVFNLLSSFNFCIMIDNSTYFIYLFKILIYLCKIISHILNFLMINQSIT